MLKILVLNACSVYFIAKAVNFGNRKSHFLCHFSKFSGSCGLFQIVYTYKGWFATKCNRSTHFYQKILSQAEFSVRFAKISFSSSSLHHKSLKLFISKKLILLVIYFLDFSLSRDQLISIHKKQQKSQVFSFNAYWIR